jgi:hypothetical protein
MLAVKLPDVDLEFSHVNSTRRAVATLNEFTRTEAAAYAESRLMDYDPARLIAEDEVMWLPTANVAMLAAIADGIRDVANLPLFEPERRTLRGLRVAALRIQSGRASATLIQAAGGSHIVASSHRFGVIIRRRGLLDAPPPGELMLLNNRAAAVMIGDFTFFKNRAEFERLFGYLEEMRAQAAATFEAVTAGLRIGNVEEMATVVIRSPAMLGKMASIRRKLASHPEYRDAFTMDKIAAFIRDHPSCGVEVEEDRDGPLLVFTNDPQHRFKILKLLDDDYLRSELTSLDYEANSKSAPL